MLHSRMTCCCVFVIVLICASMWGAGEEKMAASQDAGSEAPVWQAFEWDDLTRKLKESGRPWLPFLKVPSLDMGAYVLPANGTDRQSPHDRDEVYYIVQGKAILQVEGEDQPVQPGSIVFVAAKAKHHFHSISQELQVLVFFSSAQPKEGGEPAK